MRCGWWPADLGALDSAWTNSLGDASDARALAPKSVDARGRESGIRAGWHRSDSPVAESEGERMNCRVFRDREDEGSNPSPPIIFVFTIGNFRVSLESADTAGSQFPTEQPNRGGVNAVVVGQREIAGQRPVATQRSKPADAKGRAVRHHGHRRRSEFAPPSRTALTGVEGVCHRPGQRRSRTVRPFRALAESHPTPSQSRRICPSAR
jgi:hypothetical protein